MIASIGKWGNSPALRLPVSVLKQANIDPQQQVTIKVSRGRIVIEPVETPTFDLDQLIAGITPSNRHEEVDTGPAVGRELL